MASMQSGAGVVRSCAAEINNPKLLRATIISCACVFSALMALALLSCWARRATDKKDGQAAGGAVASAGAGAHAPPPDTTAEAMLTRATSTYEMASAEDDPEVRRRRAEEGLRTLRAAEVLLGGNRAGAVEVLRASLQQLAL